MTSLLGFLVWSFLLGGLPFVVLFTLLRRLEAHCIANGILPPELGERLAHARAARMGATEPFDVPWPHVTGERPMPPIPPSPLMMREHMLIVDVHLVRAEEYVTALGAEGHGPHLAVLFRRIRGARRALRVVTQGHH
jgi:hypothetical protein